MKRITALLLSMIMLFQAMPVLAAGDKQEDVNKYGQAYVVFGADLNQEQKAKVMELLEVTEEELADYEILTVTNKEEHQYLDQYLGASVIGSKAFSSVKVVPKKKGSGLSITAKNINFCTVSMYQNALITAGLEDAEVYIAGPFELSGTAALIGAVKASADSKNESIDEEALETATNELVLTGELGEEIGDKDAIADLIAYVKQKVLEEGLDSEEEIREVIKEAAEKLGITLDEDEIQQIIDLMHKIQKLDIDVDALKEQAEAIYDRLTDLGLDLGNVDTAGIFDFFKNIINSIVDFFKNLFG